MPLANNTTSSKPPTEPEVVPLPEVGFIPGKLTPELQQDICRMLAEFKSPMEIQRYLRTSQGLKLRVDNIARYERSTKWKPLISAARQHYLSALMEIPIAHKRIRLERLERLYQQAVKEGHTSSLRTEARGHLLAAKEEVEESKTNFTNVTITTYASMSLEELQTRRQELLDKLKALGGPRHAQAGSTPEAALSLEDQSGRR